MDGQRQEGNRRSHTIVFHDRSVRDPVARTPSISTAPSRQSTLPTIPTPLVIIATLSGALTGGNYTDGNGVTHYGGLIKSGPGRLGSHWCRQQLRRQQRRRRPDDHSSGCLGSRTGHPPRLNHYPARRRRLPVQRHPDPRLVRRVVRQQHHMEQRRLLQPTAAS